MFFTKLPDSNIFIYQYVQKNNLYLNTTAPNADDVKKVMNFLKTNDFKAHWK